jgi:hypothetical protein
VAATPGAAAPPAPAAEPIVAAPVVHAAPAEKLLSHPPRPRKKKRR